MQKKYNGFWVFCILWALLMLAGGSLFVFVDKGQVVLYFNNQFHSVVSHRFFEIYTMLGLGSVFFGVIVFLGFYKIYYFFIGSIVLILNGLVTFVLKHLVFTGFPRPTKFLGSEDLNLIDGFDYHSMNSFPSGHTFTAFAMFTLIAFVVNRRDLSVLFFILASLIGFSRMYLLQHFYMDVYAGAALGFAFSTLVIYVGENNKWQYKIKYLNQPFIKLR